MIIGIQPINCAVKWRKINSVVYFCVNLNTMDDTTDGELFYQSIYDNIMDAVLYTVPDGRVLFANPAACELFEMTPEEIKEKGRAGLIDMEDPRIPGLLEKRALTGKAKGELIWIKKDGTKFPGETSSSVFKNSRGEDRTCIVIHDLTEIRNVENELLTRKEVFKSYFENGPIAMCVNTPNNEWMEINQEFCRLIGYEKEELLSMNWEQITYPDDIEPNKDLIQKLYAGELDHFKLNKRYIHKDGEVIHVTLSLVSSRNLDGSIAYVLVSIVDNSVDFKVMEYLKEERRLLRTLVDNLPFPIYFIDKEGRKVIANKADLENIGCREEVEVLGKTDEELFPNEVGVRGHADNLSVLQTGDPIVDREEYFINLKGEKRWLHTTKVPLFDSNHQISGLVGIGLDVTQQRVLQEKVKESEAYYRSLVNVSPDGILVTDSIGTIDFVSYKVYEIFGIPDGNSLLGDSIFHWIVPEHLEMACQSFQKVVNGEVNAPSQEFKCRKFDGSSFWVESASTLLEDTNGGVKGTMIVFRDITNRKQAEEEILAAKNKAEESDKLKSAFLQNISHEIRTPMNSIMGFLEILEDPSFSRNEKKLYANIVNKSGYRLMNTINDIIEISKIMTSNMEMNTTMLDMVPFVKAQFEKMKSAMDEKGLTFTLENECQAPLQIQTDVVKLDRVVTKILENACKFTSEGSVKFVMKQMDDRLCIQIQDTGIGIEKEKVSAIFQPFYQIDHDYTRKHEGAGLGLTLAKAYLEMLGGSIGIDSDTDVGTTVTILLPIGSKPNET